MWTRTHSILSNKVTKEQMWKLFADVNNWYTWDEGIEYATMDGTFEKGQSFILKPKGAPKVKIDLIETVVNAKFVDRTKFPLATMYGEHTLEETNEGLKITTTMTVVGPLRFLWTKLVAKGIVDGLPNEMEHQVEIASKLAL